MSIRGYQPGPPLAYVRRTGDRIYRGDGFTIVGRQSGWELVWDGWPSGELWPSLTEARQIALDERGAA